MRFVRHRRRRNRRRGARESACARRDVYATRRTRARAWPAARGRHGVVVVVVVRRREVVLIKMPAAAWRDVIVMFALLPNAAAGWEGGGTRTFIAARDTILKRFVGGGWVGGTVAVYVSCAARSTGRDDIIRYVIWGYEAGRHVTSSVLDNKM